MSRRQPKYIGFLVSLYGLRLLAQQNAPAPGQIRLDVAVTDRSGRPIPGLEQQDFTLLDNKQPQTVVSFRAVQREAAESAVEVLLVIDEVNAGYQIVANERQQLENFLKQDAGKLSKPASLVFFSDRGTAIGNVPTRDGNTLIAEMNDQSNTLRTTRRSQGVYGAGERQQLSIRALEEISQYELKRPGRKLVIWISPGWPILSGPNIILTQKNQGTIFHSIVSISDALREAGITLYSIDPLGVADAGGTRISYYREFLKPARKPNQVHLGDVALQVLATQSGGLVLNSSNDIAEEITHCFVDAGTFYELTFNRVPADGPDDYHQIEIKIGKPGLTARTRSGYYAQPSESRQ